MKCYVLFLLLSMLPVMVNAETKEVEWFNRPVSIKAVAEPLESVLGKISANAQVTIVFDQSQRLNPVSMVYEDVPLQHALNRLFAHQNKSFVFNNEKKIIIVKSFGAKEYVWTAYDRDKVAFPAEMTAEEVNQLHSEQYQEYLTDLGNDDQILDNGMTRGQLKAMHEQQYQEYLNSKEDSIVSR